MSGLDKATQKEAVKEAFKEWLNEQFSQFGRFSAKGLILGLFACGVWLYIKTHGLA